jgi:hypothetical protein
MLFTSHLPWGSEDQYPNLLFRHPEKGIGEVRSPGACGRRGRSFFCGGNLIIASIVLGIPNNPTCTSPL